MDCSACSSDRDARMRVLSVAGDKQLEVPMCDACCEEFAAMSFVRSVEES